MRALAHSLGAVCAALCAAALLLPLNSPAAPAGTTIQLPRPGSGTPQTGAYSPSGEGDVTRVEFDGQSDDDGGPGAYQGSIVNRSYSHGSGHGVSVQSVRKAKSNPAFVTGFEGVNHYQQRYARGGNQFSLEPPDQALCVGNGYVVEATNDVMNVFNTSGQSVLPDNTATNIVSRLPRNVNHAVDLNSFYGYPAAVNRATGARGPSITDPSCIYDAQTKRFFFLVLTLDVNPVTGARTLRNHLDLAVSATSDPTGSWTIYSIDVTNDGTNAGGVNAGPYLGDYPHIGADANGIYLTTNSYPWLYNGFAGAQIYAMSKAKLVAGTAATYVHIDTSGLVNAPSESGSTQPGFTVWPATSPDPSQFDASNGGTAYFMSSNAADEAQMPVTGGAGTRMSQQVVVWTLSNTSSLNSATPALNLSTRLVAVTQYAVPPKQTQPGSGSAPGTDVPQGYCLNDQTTVTIAGAGCWNLLVGASGFDEVVSQPDGNDTRMQQVTYANGKLWGALDTALNPDGGAQRAGIAWFILNPSAGKVALQGYLGAAGYDFTYPAIGVTSSGRGVMAFTLSGDATNPSAGYAAIDAIAGASSWNVIPGGDGLAVDDGFTSYKALVGSPPRTRWGDYGYTAVDGNSIWVASEFIAHACSYNDWGGPFFAGGHGDNLLGTCAGTPGGVGVRTALANWSTHISKFIP
ncbi:MAG: hypothetical protein JSR36_17745 [Proteobacteria bacterium]|nr:hypothetical protein [Pseudomonadota bacterium]